MEYKIAEVSKMTDIPIDTIRYYEKIGIVSPRRKGTYRSYSTEDVYLLSEYKKMRSLGMNAEKIRNFFTISDMADYINQFRAIQEEYQKKVALYDIIAKDLEKSVQTISDAKDNVGSFRILKREAKYYIDMYSTNTMSIGQHKVWEKWIHEYYSLVEYVALYEEADKKINWVIAIDQNIIKKLSIPTEEQPREIAAGKAVYSVVKRDDDEVIDEKFEKEYKKYLKENGLKQSGTISAKLIARVMEGNAISRYLGVWIPIA